MPDPTPERIEWDCYAIMRWCRDEMRSLPDTDMHRRASAILESMMLLREYSRKITLVKAVTMRGPRFIDRHMESGAEHLIEEVERALEGEGI